MRIPFKEHGRDFDGCDCGGLLWLVVKTETGYEMPDWREFYETTKIEDFQDLSWTVNTFVFDLTRQLGKDEAACAFDVIVLRVASHPLHVGVMVNDKTFMHIMEGDSNVRQERIDSVSWRRRIDGIFRLRELERKYGI